MVLKNGELIEFTKHGANTLTFDIAADTVEQVVHLAIPTNKVVSEIEGYSHSGHLTAFKGKYIQIADEHDTTRIRELLVAEHNLMLLSSNESFRNFDSLPLCKIIRDENGQFVLDTSFVPPTLSVASNPFLSQLLHRTCNLVNAKVNVLHSRRKNFGNVADFGPHEMNTFLLLNAMAPSAKLLDHLNQQSQLHPEKLYEALLELVSRVCLFEHADLSDNLPVYQHDELSQVFAQFDSSITTLLDGVVPRKMSTLAFERVSTAIYRITTIDSSVLDTCDFISLSCLKQIQQSGSTPSASKSNSRRQKR